MIFKNFNHGGGTEPGYTGRLMSAPLFSTCCFKFFFFKKSSWGGYRARVHGTINVRAFVFYLLFRHLLFFYFVILLYIIFLFSICSFVAHSVIVLCAYFIY
jgi:hypothetical protein